MTEALATDLCIIGAGSGGLSVAAGAAQMGARVVLVEKGRMGGDCLNFGCVPSKSLIAAARAAEAIRTSVMSRELVKRSTGETLGKVTVSIGVAEFKKGDTAVSLLERADQCMFAAKRAGRNRVVADADEAGDLSDVA